MTTKPQPLIKLLLVDDHPMVLEGLKSLFLNVADIEVCGQCSSAEEVESFVRKTKPHVILMDIRLPGISGIQACALLKKKFPSLKIIMLTSHVDQKMVAEAISSGADGYLLKEIESEQLCANIRQVSQGQMAIPLSVANELASPTVTEETVFPLLNNLSEREIKIARSVSEGKINKEIADELGLNEKTIKNSLTAIFAKLDINRRSQLAVLYSQYTRTQED